MRRRGWLLFGGASAVAALGALWLIGGLGPMPRKAPGPERRDTGCEANDGPGLVITPHSAHRQVFEEDTHLAFVFQVTNRSPQVVKIHRVVPDCGCTVPQLAGTELAPGATTELTVTYNLLGVFGKAPKRRIRIVSDANRNSVAECTVSGTRQRRFRIVPPTVDFGLVRVGETPSATVTVDVLDPNMVLVPEKTLVDSKWLAVDLPDGKEDLTGATGRVVFRVMLLNGCPQGELRGRAFVPRLQDDGIGPVIHVNATIIGPVSLLPPKALMGIISAAGTSERTIRLMATAGGDAVTEPSPVRIVGSRASSPGILASWSEREPAVVRILARGEELGIGPFQEEVILKCTVGDRWVEVKLPVSGWVARSPAAVLHTAERAKDHPSYVPQGRAGGRIHNVSATMAE